MNFYKSLILLSLGLAFAQSSADLQSLIATQGSGSSASLVEQQAAMRLLESKGSSGRTQLTSINEYDGKLSRKDSSALFLSADSAMAAPLSDKDTLTYLITLDTIPADSFKSDPSILENLGPTNLGKDIVVKRKKRLVKSKQLSRYELAFFSNTAPSLFSSTTNAVDGSYTIKPGDLLVLTVFGEVEKEQSLKVNNQGKINVDGIGLVSLNNTNLSTAEALLKTKLSKIYSGISSKRTQINLRLESLSGIKVFMLGEVSKPGGYVFYGNTSILQALYLAGGPNTIGSVRQIQVNRADTTFTIDLYEYLMKGKRPEPSILLDGDIVILPRAQILAKITGDVGRPAIYELKTGESAKELLEFAGKINPTANHTLSLWSIQADGRKDVVDLESPQATLNASNAPALKDGDSLVVRTSTKYSTEYVDVVGSVWYPGLYGYKAGMKLSQAIPLAGGLKPEAYPDRVVIRRIQPDSSYTYLADSYTSPQLDLHPRDQIIVLNQAQLKTPQMVSVDGAVKQPLTLPWQQGISAKTLIAMANGFALNHHKGQLRIERVVVGKDETKIINLKISPDIKTEKDQEILLEPGDRVVVPVDPTYYEPELVSIAGAVRNPGSYSLVQTREGFKEFMDRVTKLDNNAFTQGGRLFRKRGQEVYQINFDMKDALSGKMGSAIALQAGDSIYIPKEQLTVRLVGEVVSPGDVLWEEGMDIEDYIDAAGGYTINGDDDRTIVTYADGRKSTMSRADRDPDPGSVIFVPYKKEPEPTNWTTVWTGITALVGATTSIIMIYLLLTDQPTTVQ